MFRLQTHGVACIGTTKWKIIDVTADDVQTKHSGRPIQGTSLLHPSIPSFATELPKSRPIVGRSHLLFPRSLVFRQ